MSETTSQILGHTALSRHLRAEDLDVLSDHVTQRVVVPGTVLFTEGGSAETLFVVASGRVELVRTLDGRRSVVAVLRNGDFCGERALLEGAAHETSAVALDECTLYCLDSRTWAALSEEHPRVAAKLIGLLSDKLKGTSTAGPGADRRTMPRIAAFFAARGGVGATFLATSAALVASRRLGLRTCLVELDLQFGNVDAHLGLHPERTLWDLVHHDRLDRLHPPHVEHYAVAVGDRLRVLVRPRHLTEAESIEAHHVSTLMDHLQRTFDLIIVDCPPKFDELTLTVMDLADRAFVVTTADLGGIVATRGLLAVLGRLGYAGAKAQLVVNRHRPERDLPPAERDRLFEGVTAAIMADDERIPASLNGGRRFVDEYPAHAVTSDLLRMVRDLCGTTTSAEPVARPASFLHRWLTWFEPAPVAGTATTSADSIDDDAAAPQGRRSALAEFSLGQAHYLVGRFDVAARAFERALEEDRTLAVAHFHLGEIARFDGDPERARSCFDAACRHRTTALRYRVARALVTSTAAVREELPALVDAVERHPGFADLLLLLGRSYLALGEDTKGLAQVDLALTKNPRYVEALVVRAEALRRARRYREALLSLRTALETNAGSVAALAELGEVFVELELPDLARRTLERLLKVYGAHAPSHRRVVELQEPLRLLQREIDRYGEASALHPAFGDLPFRLAVAHYQLGDFDQAAAELARARSARYDSGKVEDLQGRIDAIVPLVAGTFLDHAAV